MVSSVIPEDIMNEEEPEEDPEEEIYEEYEYSKEKIVEQFEEDPEEEICVENEEDPEEDPEEEINEESGEAGLTLEVAEEKRGSKVAEESSGKCRKSRWESPETDKSNKRRKTRWDIMDSQSVLPNANPNPSGFIDPLEFQSDPKAIRWREKVMKINKKLQSLAIHKVEKRDKLIIKMNRILSKLAQRNLRIQTPSKLVKKVFIPDKEYPSYNFVGLILGPMGNTHKKMEKESGAKILLRGKGSGDFTQFANEDLHVLIVAYSKESLNSAEDMIKKLLVPVADLDNDHKKAQLMELAKLKGTDNIICELCKEKGHVKYACPFEKSTFTDKLTKEVDYANLYVGFLPQEIDDKRLKELFVPYGRILSAVVFRDLASGLSKGYGFVKFENCEDAGAAIKYMNGYKMGGKMLAVRVAGQKPVVGPLSPAPFMPFPTLGQGFSAQIPASGQGFSAQIPASGQDFSAQIPASGQDFSAQIPTWDQGFSAQIPASGQGFSAQIPASSHDFSAQIPASGQDFSAQIPAWGQGFSAQIPTSGQCFSAQIPTWDQGFSAQIPTSQIPASGQGFSAQIPASSHDFSAQIPASGQDFSAQIPAWGQGFSAQIPTSGQGFSAQIPTSLPDSSQFPGDPEYRSCQMNSFFGGLVMNNATQDGVPETPKNSTYFPSL